MHKNLILSLLITTLLLSTSAIVFSTVQAQGDATVIVPTVNGGRTDTPGPLLTLMEPLLL